MTLIFDKDSHTFREPGTGKVVPSVTTILQDVGLIDTSWFTPESRQRGSYVHRATELYDAGSLDESTVDPIVRPYLDGWIAFCVEVIRQVGALVILAREEQVWHPAYGYAGIVDADIKGWGLVDIKTGDPAPWHPMQTAAYWRALRPFDPNKRRGCVYLRDDGSFKYVRHTSGNDFNEFAACVTVYNLKRRK